MTCNHSYSIVNVISIFMILYHIVNPKETHSHIIPIETPILVTVGSKFCFHDAQCSFQDVALRLMLPKPIKQYWDHTVIPMNPTKVKIHRESHLIQYNSQYVKCGNSRNNFWCNLQHVNNSSPVFFSVAPSINTAQVHQGGCHNMMIRTLSPCHDIEKLRCVYTVYTSCTMISTSTKPWDSYHILFH